MRVFIVEKTITYGAKKIVNAQNDLENLVALKEAFVADGGLIVGDLEERYNDTIKTIQKYCLETL